MRNKMGHSKGPQGWRTACMMWVMYAPLVNMQLAWSVETPTPSQIHLSLAGRDETGNPSGMVVAWFTAGETADEAAYNATVYFGEREEELVNVASGESNSYLAKAGFHHRVWLTALKPATRYYYRVGDGRATARDFSSTFSFVSAPAVPRDGGFRVSTFGDLGYLGSEQRPLAFGMARIARHFGYALGFEWDATATRNRLRLLKDEVDFVWHLGDIAYADDDLVHDPLRFRYEKVWNGYMDWMQDIFTEKPYQVLPGNHECECHSPACLLDTSLGNALGNFSAYNHRFHMPYQESASKTNMWYSFNYGNTHFISLNTETDFAGAVEGSTGESKMIPSGSFGTTNEQLEWLEADLVQANNDRVQRPWIIVGGHRPIYEQSYYRGNPVQIAFEDLLQKYGVDLYLCGHVHSYWRTFPVYNGTLLQRNYHQPQAPVYLVVGGAGNDESNLSPSNKSSRSTYDWHAARRLLKSNSIMVDRNSARAHVEDPSFLAAKSFFYGTGLLHVVNDTTLQFRYVSSSDGSTLDEFTLTK